MRINRFELTAFGHFTGWTLDFSAEATDFHVIFGPNEAGKSSVLRALKAWLFGFPERTRDDFIHPRNQLLVGGELSESGQKLTFFRRKKRKGDVVDSGGNTLDPSVLTPFLGGLDLSLFEALYGIDHDTLVQGGQEILARQGEIGETLFSAGAGLACLHQVLEEIEAEKNTLFRSRASKPLINQGLSLHKKLSKEIREQTLHPEQWQEAADRLDHINRELEKANHRRLELDHKRQHLERLHRALPLFSRRLKIKEQQQTLGAFHPLPSDFSKQRSDIQQEMRTLSGQHDLAMARHKLVIGRLKKLSPHKRLINKSALIEESFQRLGEYNKAKKDRPRLEGMRTVQLKEADRLLAILSPSLSLKNSNQLRSLLQQKKKVLALATSHQSLLQTQKDAHARLTTARQQLENTDKKLAELQKPGDWLQLKLSVSKGRKAGDIDKRIQQLTREYTTQTKTFTLRLRQLGHWQGSSTELLKLDIPLLQTIHLFRDELQELEQQLGLIDTQSLEIENELQKLRTRRRELIYGGEIPSEEELQEVRRHRNQGWQLICRNWIEQEDISKDAALYAPDAALHDTVFDLILQADSISDRLRFEADRVHIFASLRANEEALTTRLQKNKEKQQEVETALAQHQISWKILWQPLKIEPFTPKEMADWRVEMEQLQQQAIASAGLDANISELETERINLRQDIVNALEHQTSPILETAELAPVLMVAENQLDILQQQREALQQASRDQQQQTEQVSQLLAELEQVQTEQEQWQQKWQSTAKIPGSAEPFEPDATQDIFDTVLQIFTTLKETRDLESRLNGMDRDCRLFEEELNVIIEEVAPDLIDQTVNQQVKQLHDRLTVARKEQTLHDSYVREVEELDKEIKEGALALNRAGTAMKKLLILAGCQKEEELIKTEQNAEDHRRLAEQLEEVEQDLQQVAGELSLEEMSKQVHAIDQDSLPGGIHALAMEISGELDPAIQILAEQKGEARKILEQMDGSELAAGKAEELENNLAELRANAEHYLRLQIGVDMLRAEIENFRRQNQDPVLTIASRIFSQLTLNSFSGLKTDVDDRGEPILVAIRSENKQPLEVTAMSTGSRDQLYLALRLASLRHRAKSGLSMPFIVDDILINFDDQRGAATLQVLAEIGKNNQLILFTHHSQVAEQAEALNGVQVHRLS